MTLVSWFMLFPFLFAFLFLGVFLAAFIFWIMMLVDVVQRNFSSENDKIVWVLIIVLAGIIGAIIYYFVIKKKAHEKRNPRAGHR